MGPSSPPSEEEPSSHSGDVGVDDTHSQTGDVLGETEQIDDVDVNGGKRVRKLPQKYKDYKLF